MNHLIESRACVEAELFVSASIVDRCVMIWEIKTHPDPETGPRLSAVVRESRDFDDEQSSEDNA